MISKHEENGTLVVETSNITKFKTVQKMIDESMSTSQAICTSTDRKVVIAEEVVCSPPRKKQKDFDEEQIVMGKELGKQKYLGVQKSGVAKKNSCD